MTTIAVAAPVGKTVRRRTACPLDCPDTCTLEVEVVDGRLTSVDAAPDGEGNPLTQGFICQKVKHHARRVYAPERVLTPLVRTGAKGEGSFRAATWDEALDLVAGRIRDAIAAHGPDSLIPYVYNSSAAALAGNAYTYLLFAALGAPDVAHTICAATAGAAWEQVFGDMLSADPLDVEYARTIVVWGANPTVSNTHLLPLVTRARQQGAQLVVIDPRRTGIAARADLHLPVLPGTDVVLAYAVANLLAERRAIDTAFCDAHAQGVEPFLAAAREWPVARAARVCGLDPADIERFADLVASDGPAMLRLGWGMERNRNGGSGLVAAMSVWVLAGHFGRRGSGIITSTSGAAPMRVRRLWPGDLDRPAQRVLSMNDVGTLLCDELPSWGVRPQVLFVQGANPAATAVDQTTMLQGLARDDVFTVVHDQVVTDTARFADVVLPATTHFEADDVATSYGSYVLQPVPAVIDRVGEAHTNNEVAIELARRLGVRAFDDGSLTTDPKAMEEVVRSDGATGFLRVRDDGTTVQFVDTFPGRRAASGDHRRAVLHDPDGELPLPRYVSLEARHPLTLISPASNRTINTMFAEFAPPEAVLALSPTDASARGLADGDLVEVFDDRSTIELPLRVDAGVRPGVCHIPKGLWLRHVRTGLTANAFAPRGASDLAAGACFNDARVDVRAGRGATA
jgi:anaerobic selenocysteine-containing dehydrogenase